MSLAAIRNGVYHMLTASGPWSQNEISTCDFGVLEGAATCAIVFLPNTETRIEPDRFGTTNSRNYHRYWGMRGRLYIKDTGDSTALLSKVWQGYDDVYNTLSKDDSLNGSACAARLTKFSFDDSFAIEAAGQMWAVVEFGIQAEEF